MKKRTSTNIFAVGDEVGIADLSMQLSAVGTNRTNEAGLTMSVDWGRPEVVGEF